MEYCPRFKNILIANTSAGKFALTRTRCKMWKCAYCAGVNRAMWQAHILEKMNTSLDGKQWAFITLTAHSKAHKAGMTYENLSQGFKRLYDRIRRKFGKVEYVRVYESHKSGTQHIHAIISIHFDDLREVVRSNGTKYTYSKWLKINAVQCGLGFMTHAANITGHAGFVASYVMKYMTKPTQHKTVLPKYARRIQCSSGFGAMQAPDKGNFQWNVRSGIYEYDLDNHWHVHDIQTGHDVDYDDFLETYIYPPEFKV